MKLIPQFIDHFKSHKTISSKDVYEWYRGVKGGDSPHTYYTSIFSLLINPLVARGILTKIDRGLYKLNEHVEEYPKEIIEFPLDGDKQDEWDSYIKSKLNEEGK